MRIAVAGFQHETNTFVAGETTLADFEQADSWPALVAGKELIEVTHGMNLPIAGFIKVAMDVPGTSIEPILWCAAEPGPAVSDHAFETLSDRILHAVENMGPIDAVYLDLHGAMVTQSLEDGEGELLARMRALIGPDVPLVASLDLHANISEAMVDAADALTVFRTYPHLDMAKTGARAHAMLRAILRDGPPAKVWRQADFLVPLHAQHTGAAPAQALYGALSGFDPAPGQLAEMALGFTAADIYDCGPAVLAYASTQVRADEIADHLLSRLEQAEDAFDTSLLPPAPVVASAIKASENGTVVIADVQDNPGAGASSDTTGLLRELMAQSAPDSLLGLIHDPTLARQAHAAGVGARFAARIAGRGPGDDPVQAIVCVEHLSAGLCPYTGDMYGGGVATLGPSAALKLDGTQIRIVVTSIRNQCLDLALFRHFGLSPEKARIVCVKSTAHFRADFDKIAYQTLLTAAPGQFPCQLDSAQFTKLRPTVRFRSATRTADAGQSPSDASPEQVL